MRPLTRSNILALISEYPDYLIKICSKNYIILFVDRGSRSNKAISYLFLYLGASAFISGGLHAMNCFLSMGNFHEISHDKVILQISK